VHQRGNKLLLQKSKGWFIMEVDAIIDAAIAEIATPEASKEAAPNVEAAPEEVKTVENTEDDGIKPDSELTPEQLAKREANRKSHRDSREARMRRELRAAKAELAKGAQPKPEPQQEKPGLPKAEAFENLDEWVMATAEALAEIKVKQNQPTPLDAEAVRTNTRIQELANKEQEFASKAPDYEKLVYQDHADLMGPNGAMPEHVARALLEADDASLALYTLAKEGRLYDLEDMSPQRVAIEIGRAEERGKSYLASQNKEKVTNAPAPISKSGRTTASVSTNIQKMDAKELLEWINS
jgi:hypothetical protein